LFFNYEAPQCPRGIDGPLNFTVGNLVHLGSHRDSDVTLLHIVERIPPFYNVHLNGWDATDRLELNQSVGIHHPAGDVKKFTVTYLPLRHDNYQGRNPANSHWLISRWTNGTTEPGSSGSPLFDYNHRTIGQLHGGSASCRILDGWDSYGKVSLSFRLVLKRFLDPDDTGRLVSDGMDLK